MLEMSSINQDLIDWNRGKVPRKAPLPPSAPPAYEIGVSQPFVTGPNTSDPNAPADVMYSDPKNHKDACASILTYSGTLTDFIPSAQTIEETAQKFPAYVTKVATFPGFTTERNDQTQSKKTEANIELMINDIKAVYNGVITADVQGIIDSIQNMANTVLSQVTADFSTSTFAQSSVWSEDGSNTVKTTIFYTSLHLEKGKDGKQTWSSQEYTVNRTVFGVTGSYLVANAKQLAEMTGKTSLDEWGKKNASPTTPGIRSCFDKL